MRHADQSAKWQCRSGGGGILHRRPVLFLSAAALFCAFDERQLFGQGEADCRARRLRAPCCAAAELFGDELFRVGRHGIVKHHVCTTWQYRQIDVALSGIKLNPMMLLAVVNNNDKCLLIMSLCR